VPDELTLAADGSPLVLDLDALRRRVGTPLGASGWHTISQDQINGFADATGDHQWIHLDPERAAAGPFGTTIAHGYLTLSLAPMLLSQVIEVRGAAITVNYGLNKVRFPAPVPVGSRVRAVVVLTAFDDVGGGVQGMLSTTFEREGSDKPVCVAEILFRYYT